MGRQESTHLTILDGTKVDDRLLTTAFQGYLRYDPTPIAVTFEDNVVWVNNALEDLLAIGLNDVYGQNITEIIIDESPKTKYHSSESTGTANHNTGHQIPVRISTTPLENQVTILKITPMLFDRQQDQATIYRERLWVLANQIKIGVFYSEIGARIQFANHAMAQIYESPVETLLGTGWIDQIPPDQRSKVERAIMETMTGQSSQVEVQIRTLSNNSKDVLITLSPIISSDSKFGFAATAEDITERLQREREMEKAALFDSLTGLRNRISLTNNYQELTEKLRNNNISNISAIFCDLNKFKAINDTYGHNAGDQILISFAQSLNKVLSP